MESPLSRLRLRPLKTSAGRKNLSPFLSADAARERSSTESMQRAANAAGADGRSKQQRKRGRCTVGKPGGAAVCRSGGERQPDGQDHRIVYAERREPGKPCGL